MSVRALLVAIALLLSGLWLDRVQVTEAIPIRDRLLNFPTELGDWTIERALDLDPKVLAVLGTDDHLNRVYVRGSGPPVAAYIGYYASQRQGDSIHSPLNCLPGAGWEPVSGGRIALTPTHSAPAIEVNRYVIQKGLERQVVLYWYQSHGRIVASEYWGKAYLVLDALRLNRTDGALIRLTSPLSETADSTSNPSDRALMDFAMAMMPLLGRYLPT